MPTHLTANQKVFIITGASDGIGAEMARQLASRYGAAVGLVLAARNQTNLQAVADTCTGLGAPCLVVATDVSVQNQCQQLIDQTITHWGRIDGLINNAGVGESGSLAEVDIDRIRHIFEVNVFCTLALTQLALRGMIKRQRGTVLLVSSIAGRIPMPFLMPYSMSKFALSAAGAGLRAELQQLRCGVHVSLIEPGAIHTGFNQAMTQSKYSWMGKQSYFAAHVDRLKAEEKRTFQFLEAKPTQSIVTQIVKAAEAKKPKLRYVAPWIQGFGVRLARIFGV